MNDRQADRQTDRIVVASRSKTAVEEISNKICATDCERLTYERCIIITDVSVFRPEVKKCRVFFAHIVYG